MAFLPFVGGAGSWEMILFAVIALLLFGKRLPEVARSAGRGLIEFKRGMQGIQDDLSSAGTTDYSHSSTSIEDTGGSRPAVEDDNEPVSEPGFEPPEDVPPEEQLTAGNPS